MESRQKYQFPFASYPAIRLVILLATGIILDYQLDIFSGCWIWIGLFVLFAGSYGISEWKYQQSIGSPTYNTAIISYLGLVITFGACWHSLFDYHNRPTEATVLSAYTWQELTFKGSVQQIKQTSTGKFQVDVQIDTTIFPEHLRWAKRYKLRAVLNPDKLLLPDSLLLGSKIAFLATVYPLEKKRNPGQFNYKEYLASEEIYTQVGMQQILHLYPPESSIFSWTYWRSIVLKTIDNNFDSSNTSLAKALLIGYKNELDRQEKISFSRAGLSHIMAVSGLHVSFILIPFWFIIPLFWLFRFGKQIGLCILIIILFFYAGLTGFSASVTRASLAGGFLAYGRLFHKVRDARNLTAVAALIILILNPNDLFSIGFQLSFGAVYIILFTAPVITRKLPSWIQFCWYGKPLMIIIISLIVQIGLFPLLAYYFGEFSLAGPLANAFVIPVLGLVVPYALLLIPIGMIFPSAAHLLNVPVNLFLSYLGWFVQQAAHWNWSWIQVHVRNLLFFGIWTTALFGIASLRIPKLRWKILCVFLLLLCLNQSKKIIRKLQPATLDLLVFDVGQGDGMLITTPNKKHFLIDTGRWQPDYNSAKYVIIPYLKSKGIEKLDAIFLSHPHADHIGGLPQLIKSIPIDTIYNSGSSYDSKLFTTYHRLADEHHIPIISLTAGVEIPIDPAIRIFTYAPETKAESANVNNRSLVLEIMYGQTEMLFMGDAEKKEEQKLIADYPQLADTDFLKVGHHGSNTSSNPRFLHTISATQGVVSLAKQNQFHHPNPEAIRRLRSDSVRLHFTSLSGAIRLHSNGKHLWVDE